MQKRCVIISSTLCKLVDDYHNNKFAKVISDDVNTLLN